LSAYAEATATTQRTAQEQLAISPGLSTDKPLQEEFDDSNDETDKSAINRARTRIPFHDDETPFHQVVINATAYTTYRAVVVWIHTGHITFAPLVSKFRSYKWAASGARTQAINLLAAEQPQLPLPASPKSVDRLAHLFELDELMQLALDSIKAQLSPNMVAYKLLRDVAACYEDVRDVELGYALVHWEKAKGSEAMKEMKRLAESGQLPHAVFLHFSSFRRSSSKRSGASLLLCSLPCGGR
jgi:hypothetical protein